MIYLSDFTVIQPDAGLIFWTIIAFVIPLLHIITLIDILYHDFKDKPDKILWVIIMILIPVIGPIVYFLKRKQLLVKFST